MKTLFKLAILASFVLLGFTLMPAARADEGHDAGYKWAEENNITDAADCTGDSDSFITGCEDYVDENSNDEFEEEEE